MAAAFTREDLNSEFDTDSECGEAGGKRRRLDDVASVAGSDDVGEQRPLGQRDLLLAPPKSSSKVTKEFFESELQREGGRSYREAFRALDAFSKHKRLVNDYLLNQPGATIERLKRDTSRDRTDLDVIRANMRFIWDEETDPAQSWERALAKKYYDKLFREYCISDLSFYKDNRVAMRWRTQKEVVDGKGQFVCGEKRCNDAVGLVSWEVNFGYVEEGVKKNALVKLRLCEGCSKKLNYRHKRKRAPTRGEIARERQAVEVVDTEAASKELPEGGAGEEAKSSEPDEATIWSKPAEVEEEKSRDEEFEDFLQDLFV